MRFRPSYFPFTEPSMEVDIQCSRKGGEMRFGEGEDWLEILGLRHGASECLAKLRARSRYLSRVRLGHGIDRIAMLKYGMPDLRAFFEADIRWLNHYGFRPLDMPSLIGGLSG